MLLIDGELTQQKRKQSESYLQFHIIDNKLFRMRKSFLDWLSCHESYKTVVVRNFFIFVLFNRNCLHRTYQRQEKKVSECCLWMWAGFFRLPNWENSFIKSFSWTSSVRLPTKMENLVSMSFCWEQDNCLTRLLSSSLKFKGCSSQSSWILPRLCGAI